jgi:hypothetical protein
MLDPLFHSSNRKRRRAKPRRWTVASYVHWSQALAPNEFHAFETHGADQIKTGSEWDFEKFYYLPRDQIIRSPLTPQYWGMYRFF